MLKSYPSHVSVLFRYMMDDLGPSFSPQNSLCMLMASNKSSINTVMREWLQKNLQITQLWEKVCLILCCLMMSPWNLPYQPWQPHKTFTVHTWLVCGNFSHPPSNSNLLEKILMIVSNWYKRWKEMASTSILCDFACHGIESCSSDVTLQWMYAIEFLQLNQQE